MSQKMGTIPVIPATNRVNFLLQRTFDKSYVTLATGWLRSLQDLPIDNYQNRQQADF